MPQIIFQTYEESPFKFLRKSRKLSQKEFGNLCNLSQQTISRYENGLYYTKKSLFKIAQGLDMAIEIRFAEYNKMIDWLITCQNY